MQAAYRGAIATKANVGIGQVTLANFVWGAVRRLAPRTAPAAQQPERQLSAAAVPPMDIAWKVSDQGRANQEQSMFAGDTVKFAWSGAHDVNLMNSCDGGPAGAQRWDAFACPTNTNDATEIGSTSPASYQIPASSYKDGAYLCFFCSLAGHCGAGMHLTVKIKGGPPCNYDDLTIPPGVVARPPHSVPPLAPN